MTSISQNLTRIEADRRIEWIQEHLGHRDDQSGHWNLVRYPYSNRVMLNVFFRYPEDQTFYSLKWL